MLQVLTAVSCATCKHWKLPIDRDERWKTDTMIRPYDEKDDDWDYGEGVTEEGIAKEFGHRVRMCMHPELRRFERPDPGCAALRDGSDYMANLYTSESFGCLKHEPAEKPPLSIELG